MLAAVLAGDAWQWETARRRRIAEDLTMAHREWRAQRVVLTPPAPSTPDLPPTVRLQPGRLDIEFHGTVDLLTQLLHLTQMISDDFDRFSTLLDGA
jgi:hypothetical protein